MSDTVEKKVGVGVIVGRFQVATPHEGHREIIELVLKRHHKVILILGNAAIRATKNDPLDYPMRRRMLEEAYPNVTVLYNDDHPDDTQWVKKLEWNIEQNVPPGQKVVLYGSRDSFIETYKRNGGRHDTYELVPTHIISASNQREIASLSAKHSEDFRNGAIWACQNQYDCAYPTVDVAIVRRDGNEVITHLLMGNKKADGDLIRFIGGFVQPTDDNGNGDAYEINARRESAEETGLSVEGFQYLGTFQIDDWRYRRQTDKIITTLFLATVQFGHAEPKDDIDKLEWIDFKNGVPKFEDMQKRVVKSHHNLLKKVLETIEKQNRKAKHNFARPQ
jgi:bifunctional NMN adenylyltransferase/nudix hydrolase